ncbi:hypothetical protein ABW21_db0203410 [Orbilia brochopaga]|nr:hypothetical protein ABW21_db0203410 [Drechslerella brochopaga]
MRLLHLPQELIQHIITFVPDGDLGALERVSRRMHHLSNDPLLWRDRCSRFKYWEDGWQSISAAADIDSRHGAHHSWKMVFYRRISIDNQAVRLLDQIVASPSRRIEYTEKIASYGYDVKDCLLEQLATPETADDWLARR